MERFLVSVGIFRRFIIINITIIIIKHSLCPRRQQLTLNTAAADFPVLFIPSYRKPVYTVNG
jgi:hypothetical protein